MLPPLLGAKAAATSTLSQLVLPHALMLSPGVFVGFRTMTRRRTPESSKWARTWIDSPTSSTTIGWDVQPCPLRVPHDMKVGDIIGMWFGTPYNEWFIGEVSQGVAPEAQEE